METAQSNPFSEDSWSEQPIVAEQKNEAAKIPNLAPQKAKAKVKKTVKKTIVRPKK